MPPEAETRKIERPNAVATQDAPTGPAGSSASQAALAPAGGAASALAVREGRPGEAETEDEQADKRLDRLPMQLDVIVRVRSLRVQDLLALEKGSVLETVHEHTQDVPVRSGGALLAWAEFEVLDQQLAVRVTRLA